MGMMEELIWKASKTAEGVIGERGPEWFDRFEEKAREMADTLDPSIKAPAEAALNTLVERKDSVLHLGGEGLTALVTFMGLGKREEVFDLMDLEQRSTLDELLAASAVSTGAVVKDADASKKRKEEAVELLAAVGSAGARALLPLVLAAV